MNTCGTKVYKSNSNASYLDDCLLLWLIAWHCCPIGVSRFPCKIQAMLPLSGHLAISHMYESLNKWYIFNNYVWGYCGNIWTCLTLELSYNKVPRNELNEGHNKNLYFDMMWYFLAVSKAASIEDVEHLMVSIPMVAALMVANNCHVILGYNIYFLTRPHKFWQLLF